MASLYVHRAPEAGESWRAPIETERRLLLQAEALVALGEASLSALSEDVPDPDLPDPGSVFAVVFAWLHAEEAAWAGRVVDLYGGLTQRSVSERSAAIEAMALGPQLAIEAAVAPLLDEADPASRAMAVRVLGYRGVLSMQAWARALADEDAKVRLAAIQAPLAGYDISEVVDRLGQLDPSDHLAWQRQVRLAGLGHVRALSQARKALAQQPDHVAALGVVGLAGEASDARLLMDCVMRTAHPEGLVALAQLGHVAVVPWLYGLARRSDLPEGLARRALNAAVSIVGGPDPALPVTDLASWWQDHRVRFDPERRHHYGHRDDAQGLLAALCEPSGSRTARLRLYDRLAGRLDLAIPRFHPYDFIGKQQRDLDRMAAWLSRSPREGGRHA